MFCRAPEFLAARSQFAIAAIRSPSWFAGCTLEPKKDGHRTQGADHFEGDRHFLQYADRREKKQINYRISATIFMIFVREPAIFYQGEST